MVPIQKEHMDVKFKCNDPYSEGCKKVFIEQFPTCNACPRVMLTTINKWV